MTVAFPSDELGNRFVYAPLDLGIGEKVPRKRIAPIRRITSGLKTSLYPHCSLALQNRIFPMLPSNFVKSSVHDTFGKAHVCFSNVPGPAEQVQLVGKKVSCCRVHVCSPTTNITAFSYNNNMNILLTADDEAISHVHLMPALYMQGLSKIATDFGVAVPEVVVQAAARKGNGQ